MRAAYFSATRSSQPVRRARPVVVPNSPPRWRISSPISSDSSVGNGPAPTRVTYAFAMPQTSSMSFGPTPAPTHAAPATGFEEVTNGYVPWSMSSSAPCAPSKQHEPVRVEAIPDDARRVGDVLLEAVAEDEVLLGHPLQVERAGPSCTGAARAAWDRARRRSSS